MENAAAIRHAVLSECADPRDKVFAIGRCYFRGVVPTQADCASLVSSTNGPNYANFPIDYESSVADVYTKFTEAVIKQEESVEILHWLGTNKKQILGLPSWVPDFSLSKPVGILRGSFVDYDDRTFLSRLGRPRGSKTLPGLQVEQMRLTIKGRYLDKIQTISIEMPVSRDHAYDQPGFAEVLRGWESVAAELFERNSSPQTLITAFVRTLEGNTSPYEDPILHHYVPLSKGMEVHWYKEFGADVLAQTDVQTMRDCEAILEFESSLDPFRTQDEYELALDEISWRAEANCPGRSFFISENGAMGLMTPQAREGDSIVFLGGGRAPFVLRNREDGCFELIGDCLFKAFGSSMSDLLSSGRKSTEVFEDFVLT